MVSDVKNYTKKDAKNSDTAGEFPFFRTHNGGKRSQLPVTLCVSG